MNHMTRRLPSAVPLLALALLAAGCGGPAGKDFISSAVIESQAFLIATTVQGAIVAVYKSEGQPAAQGETVAVIDTIPFVFKHSQVLAGQAELRTAIAAKKGEIVSQESDLAGLEREYKRVSDLVDKGSLPSQQKDNLETQLQSARLRIEANRLLLSSMNEKAKGLDVQLAEVKDMLRRCYVLSPAAGTVVTRYKNQGEVVLPGNPIFQLARYDTMQADFFVPQPLLPTFKLGQQVRIRIDAQDPKGRSAPTFVPAAITWISSDAEFTPKNIQTRESRNELVFKIRATAANTDGALKRGLPVEIWR